MTVNNETAIQYVIIRMDSGNSYYYQSSELSDYMVFFESMANVYNFTFNLEGVYRSTHDMISKTNPIHLITDSRKFESIELVGIKAIINVNTVTGFQYVY